MKDKFVVKVDVPALGNPLELIIPTIMKVGEAISLMVKMIPGFSSSKPKDLWLVDVEGQKRLPNWATCSEVGLKTGSRLMLLWIN